MKHLCLQLSWILCLLLGGRAQATVIGVHPPPPMIKVPARITFCGMQLNLTTEGQRALQRAVNRLLANPAYVQALGEKATTFHPYMKDAFDFIGVPDDLFFICLQESELRGDAISTSNAVGFWQMKQYTAEEVGLVVSPTLDERRHISRATLGAARYLYRSYLRYENWIYAVIAYYEGPTGALPYTDATYYGAREMPITEKLHWYALKVLAHKLVYEKLVTHAPRIWLEAKLAPPGQQLTALASLHKLPASELRRYNLWMMGSNMPTQRPISYFVPHTEQPPIHLPDPELEYYKPLPQLQQDKEEEEEADSSEYPLLPQLADKPVAPSKQTTTPAPGPDLTQEPYYGTEFSYAEASDTPEQLAIRLQLPLKRLARYNEWTHRDLRAGELVLLVSASRVHVHVVRPGEQLTPIAARYGVNPAQLAMLNRLGEKDSLPPGLRLHLRQAKPTTEGKVVYRLNQAVTTAQPVVNAPKPNQPASVKTIAVPLQAVTTAKAKDKDTVAAVAAVVAPQLGATTHTVQAGETLYSLAKRYGTTAAAIRLLSNLPGDKLSIGQVLRVR